MSFSIGKPRNKDVRAGIVSKVSKKTKAFQRTQNNEIHKVNYLLQNWIDCEVCNTNKFLKILTPTFFCRPSIFAREK